jgi:membrane-associated phospholipid phosphatase
VTGGAGPAGRRALAVASACAAIAASAPAAADHSGPTAPDWAFRSPGAEVAIATVSALSLAGYLLPQQRSSWGPYRPVRHDSTLDWISDFTGAIAGSVLLAGGTYAFEGGYLAEHGAPQPYARALRTSLIDLEAVLLTSGIVATVKRLAGRCRPRSWFGSRCEGEDEEHTAFPSGHTGPVAAIAGVHLSLATRTPGHAGLRLGAVGLAEAATLVTMALRIGAGAHSWEDVGAGFIVGHVTGVALGYAHPMVDLATAGEVAGPGTGSAAFAWGGTF